MTPDWLRSSSLLIAAIPAFAQNPRDPEGLVRLMESARTCDFNALWDALELHDPWAFGRSDQQHPTRPCRIERVYEGNTREAPVRIFALHDPDLRRAYYLRYVQQATWRIRGAQMVESKNHPHRHEVVRGRDDQVYLRVSTQGASGSDIDSEVEQWFDLVRPEFAAVLSLPVVGHEQRHGFGISPRFRSTIRPLEADSRHLIAAFEVTLLVQGRPVGEVRYRAVYVPDATGMMRLSEASGPGSLQDFQPMLTIGDDGPSNEFLLPHAFAGLRALALEARRSKSPDPADGLRFLLRQMKPNNSQVRELKAILR